MKKIKSLLAVIAIVMAIFALCACGEGDPKESSEKVPTAYTGPVIVLPEV